MNRSTDLLGRCRPHGSTRSSTRYRSRPDRPEWLELAALHPHRRALLVVLFNAKEPTLFGFPRFYWLQLAFIVLGVGTTTLVYQMTKGSPRSSGR